MKTKASLDVPNSSRRLYELKKLSLVLWYIFARGFIDWSIRGLGSMPTILVCRFAKDREHPSAIPISV
jgi:hypothetical protein